MAWRPVLAVAGSVAGLLLVASHSYGYHRDELYFRMLPPQAGYVDQPPLTPLLARAASAVVDRAWAMHAPGALLMAVSIVVVTLVAQELGGDRRAQTVCACAYGTALVPLEFARVLITATVDLVVWPTVVLLVLRAVLRRPSWWLAVGVAVGLSTYNKWLVALLVTGLVAGVALVGPRRLLGSTWVWAGGLLALALAAPNLIYQATHGWPQLAMGRALAQHNAAEVRLVAVPMLLVMLGLPLVPIWWAGLLGLAGRVPAWRPARFVAAALPVVVVLTLVGATQPYYPLGLLSAVLAAGCVVVARRRWVVPAIAVNAVISAVIALPVVPRDHLAGTPITTFNQIAQDEVGWPAYVADVARARSTLSPAIRAHAVVVTDNYGEAGAVDRYGARWGIDEVYSAQNELYHLARPPDTATTAIVVGTAPRALTPWFASCRVVGVLDDDHGVHNQEQGRPISLCEDPVGGWASVWPRLQHYD